MRMTMMAAASAGVPMARCRRLSILTLVCLISPAWATHTETRQYSILVDGKEAGQSQITIVEQDDGRTYMTASAKVQLKGLVVNYDFSIEGQEWWKDGKLVGMKALCNDNGKRCDLLITQQAGQLTARVNGIDHGVHPDVWTTSYWKLADARFHNQLIACYHFRVTGGEQPVDLWFDQYHRLVRQEFTRSGHKTIIQLVGKK